MSDTTKGNDNFYTKFNLKNVLLNTFCCCQQKRFGKYTSSRKNKSLKGNFIPSEKTGSNENVKSKN